jgi:hypothetical protein
MDPFVARSAPRVAAAIGLLGVLALAALLAGGCGAKQGQQPVVTPPAGGDDGGPIVGQGAPDGGVPDAGPPVDPGPTFGTQGPWPVENRSYGNADGIDDGPVVSMSTDEGQNRWVATPNALFLLKPGATRFVKFTSRDGLHLADNPVKYIEDYCGGDGSPASVAFGSASDLGISTIVGGRADEVFVGYWGDDEDTGDCHSRLAPNDRHSGKLDRVRLLANGTLQVDRFDLATTGMGMQFWHNRTVLRMVYDHQIHPHTLYVAANHGVDMIFPDKWRERAVGEWIDVANMEWMADHLHVAPCKGGPCPTDGSEGPQLIGWWKGLALAPDGGVWHAGRWAAGKIRFTPTLHDWEFRAGHEAFEQAFGDAGVPPVFPVAVEGDVVSLKAVSVAGDGTAWFGSGNNTGAGADSPRGIASFSVAKGFTYYSYDEVGLGEQDVEDLVALPDGRVVFGGPNTGIVLFDPATGKHAAIDGLPDGRVVQMELDTMVNPPALHVATRGGATVIRVFPKIP